MQCGQWQFQTRPIGIEVRKSRVTHLSCSCWRQRHKNIASLTELNNWIIPFKTTVEREGKTYSYWYDRCVLHTLPSGRDSSLKLEPTANERRGHGNIIAFVMLTRYIQNYVQVIWNVGHRRSTVLVPIRIYEHNTNSKRHVWDTYTG